MSQCELLLFSNLALYNPLELMGLARLSHFERHGHPARCGINVTEPVPRAPDCASLKKVTLLPSAESPTYFIVNHVPFGINVKGSSPLCWRVYVLLSSNPQSAWVEHHVHVRGGRLRMIEDRSKRRFNPLGWPPYVRFRLGTDSLISESRQCYTSAESDNPFN
jgi:hypothetical protein